MWNALSRTCIKNIGRRQIIPSKVSHTTEMMMLLKRRYLSTMEFEHESFRKELLEHVSDVPRAVS